MLSGTYDNLPAAGTENRSYACTDTPVVLRDTGSEWIQFPVVTPISTPFSSSGWTEVNSPTVAYTNGLLSVTAAYSAASRRGIRRTAPGTPYTIRSCIVRGLGDFTSCGIGMWFYESSSGYYITLELLYTGANAAQLQVEKMEDADGTNAAAYTASTGDISDQFMQTNQFKYMALEDDGTNLKWHISADGRLWYQFESQLRDDYFTTGPDAYGFFCRSYNASNTGRMTSLGMWQV